jgi:hypothetical protein
MWMITQTFKLVMNVRIHIYLLILLERILVVNPFNFFFQLQTTTVGIGNYSTPVTTFLKACESLQCLCLV